MRFDGIAGLVFRRSLAFKQEDEKKNVQNVNTKLRVSHCVYMFI